MDKLTNVHPNLIIKANKIIDLAKSDGFDVRVTQGFRSFDEQNKLYNQRPQVTKARGGSSYHNYGLAVDFGFFDADGKYIQADTLYHNIGKYAVIVGVEWGGNWPHFKDKPHIQFLGMPSSASHLMPLFLQKGLAAVWRQFDNK